MLTLNILSPEGRHPAVTCDSVHLILSDDDTGKGGGSCGIRTGHAKAMLALSKGSITAFMKEEKVFEVQTGGGFATVENDVVTVVAQTIIS